MQAIIYFLIAIIATTVGALTGMGGGVIIKPLLDMIGEFDAATLGVMSSATVFAMAIVSVIKQLRQKAIIDFKVIIPLSIGSIVGGSLGQKWLSVLIALMGNNREVIITQNICLAVLIAIVFIYILNKNKILTLNVKGLIATILVGIILGIFSSFLGIGGGPINVALLIFVFSYDTKIATIGSIATILFAQISKLGYVLITTGFSIYDLKLLPPMIVGGIAGGFIGSMLNKKLSEKKVEKAFNLVQLLVLCICILNILRNI